MHDVKMETVDQMVNSFRGSRRFWKNSQWVNLQILQAVGEKPMG